MKRNVNELLPPICLRCKHKHAIEVWENIGSFPMPFCNVSRNTCHKKHGKSKCQEYEYNAPTEMNLF